MRQRIFRSFAILIIAAIALTFAAMEYISYQDFCADMKSWAREDARLLGEYTDKYGSAAVDDSTAGIIDGRVTLIAADGTVLYDSDEDSSVMENHLKRPEVQDAFETGSGSATRRSATFGKQTYYYAYRTPAGAYVIRISRTMDTVIGEVLSRFPIAGVLIVMLILIELFLARSVTGKIVEPINSINLSNPKSEPVYEELEPLLSRIELQNEQIRMQMDELKQADMVRRDFTANVSHELKTPLMSISGYAELIENGLAKQGDIPGFASRIHSEALRLKNLVDDIIRLSSLEDTERKRKEERADLYEISEEVIQTLTPYADEQGVQLNFAGDHVPVYASKQVLFEMIYNLVDNAVKYNRSGGSADLTITETDGRPVLEVIDTGIGIAPEDQERVFERFYRVDKSHSRQTGGTGLGLSIVKHAAALYSAEVSIVSEPGLGTKAAVVFPPRDGEDDILP